MGAALWGYPNCWIGAGLQLPSSSRAGTRRWMILDVRGRYDLLQGRMARPPHQEAATTCKATASSCRCYGLRSRTSARPFDQEILLQIFRQHLVFVERAFRSRRAWLLGDMVARQTVRDEAVVSNPVQGLVLLELRTVLARLHHVHRKLRKVNPAFSATSTAPPSHCP